MVNFSGCKLTFLLEAQSPMVHFQHEHSILGMKAKEIPTLRATEVKSKLDHFIINRIIKREKITLKDVKSKNQDEAERKIKEIYPDYFADKEHSALKYKMEISEDKEMTKEREIRQKGEELFYIHGKKQKIFRMTPRVTIICFNKGLRQEIESAIEDFFLVTNFGGKQRKGFGSFLIEQSRYGQQLSETDKKEIARKLKEETGASSCYEMTFGKKEWDDIFFNMNMFYKVMKSGLNRNKKGEEKNGRFARSYIYTYMHKRGIDNEKAWMKQEGIAPIKGQFRGNVKNPKYVRALLGTGNELSYINPNRKISISNDVLERVPSPIYFKVIKNTVFIVACPVLEEVYGKIYKFSSKDELGKVRNKVIKTPEEYEFNIEEFLKEYVSYYNNEFRKQDAFNVKGVKYLVKVGETCD